MAVELYIVPGKIVDREDFVKSHPPFSIALDGYVAAPPFFEITPTGPYRNFNHHEMVDRTCTCATCEQCRRAVILGLYELYSWPSGPRATLWVNDCDQDVCLATWILMNPDRASEPHVQSLTYIEDLLDMSAGAFPVSQTAGLLGEVRWVFEAYTSQRSKIGQLDAAGMRDIIDEVHKRIDKFVRGKAEKLELQGGYEVLGGGHQWTLAEVEHQHARQRLLENGVNAAVELYSKSDDHYWYSIWRRSEYITTFPVLEILAALSRAEGFEVDDPTGWGGSDNVGGSPRGVGSKLPPSDVEEVVNEVVDRTLASRNFQNSKAR